MAGYSDGPLTLCTIMCNFCCLALWITAFLLVSDYGTQAIEKQFFQYSYVNQIPRDWDKEFVSSIMVTEETTCPPSHPLLLFSRPWYGSDLACNCIGTRPDGLEEFMIGKYCTSAEQEKAGGGCKTVPPIAPVIMGQINRKRFCGKSSGYNFMTARRPKLSATGPICELSTDQACHNGAPEN